MKKITSIFLMAFATAFSPNAFANYACSGTVGYLGIEGNGNVVVALDNSTKIHKICSLDSQGSYSMVISACKATYSALLVAKTSGKSIKIYYYDNGYTCNTIPEWNIIHEAYFVEGPY